MSEALEGSGDVIELTPDEEDEFRARVSRGLKQIEEGRTLSHEEMRAWVNELTLGHRPPPLKCR